MVSWASRGLDRDSVAGRPTVSDYQKHPGPPQAGPRLPRPTRPAGTATVPQAPMTSTLLPTRRSELLLDRGVLEDPRAGDFYNLGPRESFLFARLDGRHSTDELTRSFEAEFGEPLPPDDL